MLRIVIAQGEGYDEEEGRFVPSSETVTIDLEHSLVSLSKWECRYEKPFLGNKGMTREQTLDYVLMMILGEIPPEEVLVNLSDDHIKQIDRYINAKMTATTFKEREQPRQSREIVTSELIYYWMISLNIPFECQDWHLARLLALIRVCNIKNAPKKKGAMSSEGKMTQAQLNAQRRAQMGTSG